MRVNGARCPDSKANDVIRMSGTGLAYPWHGDMARPGSNVSCLARRNDEWRQLCNGARTRNVRGIVASVSLWYVI